MYECGGATGHKNLTLYTKPIFMSPPLKNSQVAPLTLYYYNLYLPCPIAGLQCSVRRPGSSSPGSPRLNRQSSCRPVLRILIWSDPAFLGLPDPVKTGFEFLDFSQTDLCKSIFSIALYQIKVDEIVSNNGLTLKKRMTDLREETSKKRSLC